MALIDVLSDVTADKKEKKAADKKYVTFTSEEWKGMEAKQGKEINPTDVKKIVLGIFEGRYSVSVAKKPTV
jgi:hypothetical protein